MSTDPLFMRNQGGEYFWYHNDHLGTPQMMTTSSGAVVWKAKYSSFGKATVDPSSTIDNPLRFPGQYEDVETGLHYNGYRYFDVKIGRYLRIDPIGFLGGDANLYAYVSNDPVNAIDPDGRFAVTGTIALIWGGIEFALSIYDAWDTIQTLTDPCASGVDKGAVLAGLAVGALAPGGGYGTAAKGALNKADDTARLVLGKMDDLKKTTGWDSGDLMLLLNKNSSWNDNKKALQAFMDKGSPIKDLNPYNNTGFLGREHQYLNDAGWTLTNDGGAHYWVKPQ